MELKNFSWDLAKILTVIFALAAVMVSITYGVNYIFTKWSSPVPLYITMLLFSIGFVVSSVFFEKRDAEFPWSLVGGAVASSSVTFIVIAAASGIVYLKEAQNLNYVNLAYAVSISMILSAVTVTVARHKLI